MMPDTPLEEVASHLPAEAAKYLMGRNDQNLEQAVLKHIRTLVVFWETHNYVFDPVLYEGMLTALVPSMCGIYAELFKSIDEKVLLNHKLRIAEATVDSLSGLLTNHVCEGKS